MSKTTILVLVLLAGTATAQGRASAEQEAIPLEELAAHGSALQASHYQQATEALDRGAYERAIELFEQVIAARESRGDAARYWIAYARYRSGDPAAALARLGELRAVFATSKWLDDARILEVEIRAASGQVAEPEADDDEQLRLYALNSLLHVDSERALPLLEGILRGEESDEMKSRALLVLMQSGSETALDIVAELALSEADGELRTQALRHLGMSGGERATAILEEVYSSTTDVEVKQAILQGYMMSGDSERLLRLARSETDKELRVNAIRALAMTGASDELWELYEQEASIEAKQAILQSMFMTGKSGRLLEVARTESNLALRKAAIHGLAMIGGGEHEGEGGKDEMLEGLIAIYSSESDPELRGAVLQALWMRGDAGPLVDLFNQESDPELRKQIVQGLSMMESEEAIEFLIRLIER